MKGDIKMKNRVKYFAVIIISIFVIGTLHVSAMAFSGGSGGGMETEAPYGLAISHDAPGVKIVGIMIVEYINRRWQGGSDHAEMARVLLRLKKGNELRLFYDEVPGPMSPERYPLETQQLIMGKMTEEVLAAFFPGKTDLEATVKLITNFTTISGPSFLPRNGIDPGYDSCETITVCTIPGNSRCDTEPDLWIDILSCKGNYEFCGNGVDDDGDLRPDTEEYPFLNDPKCDENSDYYHWSAFTVSDVDLAIK